MIRIFRPAILAAAVLAWSFASSAQQDDQQAIQHGKLLLTDKCGRCHQVAATGKSPLAEAPTFTEVMRRYKPDQLEEALAEGLSTGHPAMPEFVFEPDDVTAILAYLATLRPRR